MFFLLLLFLSCFIEIRVFNGNSVEPGQTPRVAASDLGLHCLSAFILWYAKHNRVKNI